MDGRLKGVRARARALMYCQNVRGALFMSRIWFIVVCFATLQCFVDSTGARTLAPLEALRGAPKIIDVDGVVVQLEAHVWRDFMPGLLSDTAARSQESEVRGRPLTATLRVIARDGLQIPKSTRVDVAWVILGDQVWESRPSEEQPRVPAAHEVVVTMRNGPKWPPKAVVDVVVRIVDANGATHLLASRALKIEAAM